MDWLMTAVGPPPCATSVFFCAIENSLPLKIASTDFGPTLPSPNGDDKTAAAFGKAGRPASGACAELKPWLSSPVASSAILGDSSTVELRTLTPSILVRIQVPQPYNILILLDIYFRASAP